MMGADDPYRLVAVNVMGTVNLLELARIRKTRRVVCCSSTSAYGDTPPGLVAEDVVLRPGSVLGPQKRRLSRWWRVMRPSTASMECRFACLGYTARGKRRIASSAQ